MSAADDHFFHETLRVLSKGGKVLGAGAGCVDLVGTRGFGGARDSHELRREFPRVRVERVDGGDGGGEVVGHRVQRDIKSIAAQQ